MSDHIFAEDFESDAIATHSPTVLPVPFPAETSEGIKWVVCARAEEMVLNLSYPAGAAPFALLAFGAEGTGDQMLGMYVPLDAKRLRDQAAMMLRMADKLDQGRGKQ
jgi:hypothetical protein